MYFFNILFFAMMGFIGGSLVFFVFGNWISYLESPKPVPSNPSSQLRISREYQLELEVARLQRQVEDLSRKAARTEYR